MPHVDEGTLHALLDGALPAEEPERAAEVEAHLRSCPDCRALLKEAAGLRADAAAILAAAAPAAMPGPDFADVHTRADTAREGAARGSAAPGRTRDPVGPGRQLRWTAGIAWAASLVLALGTGYLLRDLAGPVSPAEVRPTAESARRAGDRSEPLTGSDFVAEPEMTGSGRRAARAADAASPPPARSDIPTDLPPVPSPSAAAVAEEASPQERRPPEAVELEEITVTGAAAPPGSVTGAPSAPGAAKTGLAPTMATPSQRSLMSRSEGGEALGEVWVSATLAEARAAVGGPVYRLPRARIEETFVGSDPASPRVLTLQRLESGVPVRVVQSPGAAQPSPEAAEPGAVVAGDAPTAADRDVPGGLPAPEVARVTVDRWVLEVTGSLPLDLLRILAESATPAP